ncbi:P-loop containing nucleoside triphosphate hydrolase protein [Aspergillus avenaceus]|uniref:Kinesin-like protein n=1 Tax=Aspergillus avenaceus TaxID=36643 RepID=A0A5N6U665_ASPAV|nr:P-loop containing nucleoside triphosphate hydrolase protein [Aspergillus avenaceus]
MHPLKVYTRWRPLTEQETPLSTTTIPHNPNYSITLSNTNPNPNTNPKPWKSDPTYAQIFAPTSTNQDIYETVVLPTLPDILKGNTSNILAYGHSGTGKTHTIFGYDFAHSPELGICLSTAKDLLDTLHALNHSSSDPLSKKREDKLGLGVRMYELRQKTAFDLLNSRRPCHVREGYDGRTHIRGETEVLDEGKVRVRPVVAKACWGFEEVLETVRCGLGRRATGSSGVHDLSSRTHAVVELEIVSWSLLQAREGVVERESELVPVAKAATDVYLREHMRALVLGEGGEYVVDPGVRVDLGKIEEAEGRKRVFEGYVKEAEERVRRVFEGGFEGLGGRVVFVDLAGSEYFDRSVRVRQTPQEVREGRQINSDLLALKEVIRARALKMARIPFRASPLTMVLREHFVPAERESYSAMILTVSSAAEQVDATLNTLKYGNLVGVAGKGGR